MDPRVRKTCTSSNDDGSVTVYFGDAGDARPNSLTIVDGWNYTVRLYRPNPEVVGGSWTFPAPEPV